MQRGKVVRRDVAAGGARFPVAPQERAFLTRDRVHPCAAVNMHYFSFAFTQATASFAPSSYMLICAFILRPLGQTEKLPAIPFTENISP